MCFCSFQLEFTQKSVQDGRKLGMLFVSKVFVECDYYGCNAITKHFTIIWGVYRVRRRNNLGVVRIPPKLLRRSFKNAQNAISKENKGGGGLPPPAPFVFVGIGIL